MNLRSLILPERTLSQLERPSHRKSGTQYLDEARAPTPDQTGNNTRESLPPERTMHEYQRKSSTPSTGAIRKAYTVNTQTPASTPRREFCKENGSHNQIGFQNNGKNTEQGNYQPMSQDNFQQNEWRNNLNINIRRRYPADPPISQYITHILPEKRKTHISTL